jgi:hypothetical protein
VTGTLIYCWTATSGSTNNWVGPKSIADMYYDHRDMTVDGMKFSVRYPITEKPSTAGG